MAADKGGHPTPLGTRGPERFLRRQYNLAGPTPAGLIMGGVQAEIELRPKDAWDFAQFGIIPWAHTAIPAAVAAEHAYVEVGAFLTRPNYDVVVHSVKASVACAISVQALSVGDVAAGAGTSRDTLALPFGTALSTVAWIVSATALPAAFTGPEVWFLNAGEAVRDLNVVIRSGSTNVLIVKSSAVNLAALVNVMGYLVPVDMGSV